MPAKKSIEYLREKNPTKEIGCVHPMDKRVVGRAKENPSGGTITSWKCSMCSMIKNSYSNEPFVDDGGVPHSTIPGSRSKYNLLTDLDCLRIS